MLTNACRGLQKGNRWVPGRPVFPKHEWCTGWGVKLVPGRINYLSMKCGCECHAN